MNYILRPVFNRPEMLYLSLEYEKKAREAHQFSSELTTMFLVEYGTPKEVMEMLYDYPYPKEFVMRNQRHGLSMNILEGMKEAFAKSDSFVIHLEDDILLHVTYFKYMDVLLDHDDLGSWSVLSGYSPKDNGPVNKVVRGHHYAALASVINKEFHSNYILPISNPNYYKNPFGTANALDDKYKEYTPNRVYKYRNPQHVEQAGIINRLVDVAMIEEKIYVIMPLVNRHQHIGYYGKNRQGGSIPGNNFIDRLKNLREIIKDPNKMYEMSSKQYNDYRTFSPKLDEWDGTITFK